MMMIGVESIPNNTNNSSKDNKHGLGHVTSASDDDHYYAHKTILAAASQLLKTKKEIINYSLFFICKRPLVMTPTVAFETSFVTCATFCKVDSLHQ